MFCNLKTLSLITMLVPGNPNIVEFVEDEAGEDEEELESENQEDVAEEVMREPLERKRDRTNENFSKNIRSLMRRMDEIGRKYHVDIYFCTKYRKYFEYSSNPSFRPRPEDIVRQLSRI